MAVLRTTEGQNDRQVTILLEVDDVVADHNVYGGDHLGDRLDRVVATAHGAFADGLELVRTCAAQIVNQMASLDDAIRPDEYQVQLAVKFDSEVGAVIAKAAAGAQLQVSLTWKHNQR